MRLDIMGGILTDEHPVSSYGQPVFVRGFEVYGPCDKLPEHVIRLARAEERGTMAAILNKPCPVYEVLASHWALNNDFSHTDLAVNSFPDILRKFYDLGMSAEGRHK